MSDFVSRADYLARCFVQGVHRNAKTEKLEPVSASWADRFLEHPWVRQSVHEGWDRALRAHVVAEVKRRVMGVMIGQNAADVGMGDVMRVCPDIRELMPPKEFAENERKEAHRYALAKQWRDENPKALERPVKPGDLRDVTRGPFGAMQRASQNIVHQHPRGLSPRSRAMAGEGE